MPASLTFDRYFELFTGAAERLVASVEQTGLTAPVPTCPGWTGANLLAHQTMVHRWATGLITGASAEPPDDAVILNTVTDLPAYVREGAAELAAALRSAPEDLEAMTFLNDAPAPRLFWARRQAHETTVHAVDGLAAQLGRMPT